LDLHVAQASFFAAYIEKLAALFIGAGLALWEPL
jgi:hypothetical protein